MLCNGLEAGGLGSAEQVRRKLKSSPRGRCGPELLLWATVRGGVGAEVPASEGRWGELCLVGAEPRLCVCGVGGGSGWQMGLPGALASYFWLSLHHLISRVATRGKKIQSHHPKGQCFLSFPTCPSLCLSSVCVSVHLSPTYLFLLPSTLINGSSTRFQGKGAEPGSMDLHAMLREPSGKSHQGEGIPARS